MYWYDHDVSSWGYPWMGLGMVVFWSLLIVGFALALRYLYRTDSERCAYPVLPLGEHVLAERFARGEIEAKEYADRSIDRRWRHDTRWPRRSSPSRPGHRQGR
ncbi:putative membrane protein [Nocardia ignorata]|uniref:Putative membrane protein n=1 Tax=Nocardia ignorata TaxID=145285 RepID=A0A4R6P2S2_NOCIG|nr:putative membrane protein [Nocardia ignorata]